MKDIHFRYPLPQEKKREILVSLLFSTPPPTFSHHFFPFVCPFLLLLHCLVHIFTRQTGRPSLPLQILHY